MYSIKLYIGIAILTKFALPAKVSLISVAQFSIGAQFLNAACVAAASGSFLQTGLLPAAAIVLVTAISPVTKIYASE